MLDKKKEMQINVNKCCDLISSIKMSEIDVGDLKNRKEKENEKRIRKIQ